MTGEMFSFWRTSVPAGTAKKKLLVDDSVLLDLFARLEDKTDKQDVQFRFVLALILMRKRILRYEGVEEKPAGRDAKPEPRAPVAAEGKPAEVEPEVWR